MIPTKKFILKTRLSLLTRLKHIDDKCGWDEFVKTYYSLIYGTAIQKGLTKAEAEDAFQETLIAVAKAIPTFVYDPALGSFKTWLLGIARHKIYDQFNNRLTHEMHKKRYQSPETSMSAKTSIMNNIPDKGPSVDVIWDDQWKGMLILKAMEAMKQKIKPEHFQIYDLYVNKQWSALKIAKTMEINIAKVYLIKTRINSQLQKEVAALRKKIN